jgi:glycogen operon protein
MVKAFHAAGLEVILDVVYNHTAEAGVDGPTLSFRGLDDLGFYQRVGHRPGRRLDDTYWDVTGCGNTVDAATRSRCG